MRRGLVWGGAALWLQIGCSGPQKPATPGATPAAAAEAPRVVQFYAATPRIARGEKSLLCYSVENARSVRLFPPPQQLSASLSRCLEVAPAKTTTYTLTAEADSGPPVSRDVTVTVGAPRPRILDVTVSALTLKPGELLSICYRVENAQKVSIDPIGYAKPSRDEAGCTTAQPRKTTTYTVTASGAGGEQDQESVTVKVQ